MIDHLYGTKPCPAPTLDISSTPNPEYEEWESKDNYLICWLLNSLTPDVAQQVVGHPTCHSTWTAIEDICGAHNRAKIQICRTNLQTTRKAGRVFPRCVIPCVYVH
ncbi:hypothetical protein Sjap_013447 [Stephania japonica]|uniref:Uncharacterized protein n=1 Tax=Stephania japonica TaxID=461633 RepID=A0AAP0IYQ1_9MAGN